MGRPFRSQALFTSAHTRAVSMSGDRTVKRARNQRPHPAPASTPFLNFHAIFDFGHCDQRTANCLPPRMSWYAGARDWVLNKKETTSVSTTAGVVASIKGRPAGSLNPNRKPYLNTPSFRSFHFLRHTNLSLAQPLSRPLRPLWRWCTAPRNCPPLRLSSPSGSAPFLRRAIRRLLCSVLLLSLEFHKAIPGYAE
jgi:hypothetical protein